MAHVLSRGFLYYQYTVLQGAPKKRLRTMLGLPLPILWSHLPNTAIVLHTPHIPQHDMGFFMTVGLYHCKCFDMGIFVNPT